MARVWYSPQRLVGAAICSWAGLRAAWAAQFSFRLEVISLIFFVPLGLWLGKNGVERALLLGSLAVVLITEMINSAIETVVDRIGIERHDLSGRAKDLGSAAVFLALMHVVLVWAMILLP
jgi:diacylglycerol kinase (ATP)